MVPNLRVWDHFYFEREQRMTFEELLALLVNPGEDGAPETIYDDLSASYTDATSTRDSKIGELEAALSEATAEISRVKSMNYDLMVAAAADNVEELNDNDNPDNDPDDVGEIDDFFEDKD